MRQKTERQTEEMKGQSNREVEVERKKKEHVRQRSRSIGQRDGGTLRRGRSQNE